LGGGGHCLEEGRVEERDTCGGDKVVVMTGVVNLLLRIELEHMCLPPTVACRALMCVLCLPFKKSSCCAARVITIDGCLCSDLCVYRMNVKLRHSLYQLSNLVKYKYICIVTVVVTTATLTSCCALCCPEWFKVLLRLTHMVWLHSNAYTYSFCIWSLVRIVICSPFLCVCV
jgi:hypothetical protein